jgi:hypothetical protein
MSADSPGRKMLDLSQFVDASAAVAAAQREKGFDESARPVLEAVIAAGGEMTLLYSFFTSAVTRARGLHEAILREVEAENPHAVFPLIRQFAEVVAVVYYVADRPSYVRALAERPRDRRPNDPARKTVQALIGHMDKHYSDQFGLVYQELCEIAHFGAVAMWASHHLTDDRTVTWTSYPRWRRPEDPLIACAYLLELSEAIEHGFRKLGRVVVDEARSRTTK